MRTITLATTVVLGLVLTAQNETWAQSPEEKSADPILREYRSKLPLLVERYSTNRKIRARDIRYVIDPKAGERVGDESVNILGEVVTDGQQMKAHLLEGKLANPVLEQRKSDVNFWRSDMRFDVTRNGSKFKIVNQELASASYHSHEVAKYMLSTSVPMTAGGNCVGTSLWFDDRSKNRGGNSVLITVVDVNPATWKGRECVEVRSKWDNRHGMVELASTFLDPANDYITIATETDWKTNQQKKEYKAFSEVEYQPSAEGFPLPKFVRMTLQYRDGVTRKVRDIEFLSYERYVPSPEEFQLEKPYGLTTPAVVPTTENKALTPPAAQRRIWPWLVIGAGAVLAVMSVVFIRRSRKQEAPAIAPVAKV